MTSAIGGRLGSLGGGRGYRFGRLGLIVAGAILLILLLASSFTYVNPGYVGIVIHRAGGGVDRQPLGPGLHGRNPLTTGIVEYPVFMQTLLLTRSPTEGTARNDEINVNSVEGQPLSLDVSMSFELDPASVPKLYETFRMYLHPGKENRFGRNFKYILLEWNMRSRMLYQAVLPMLTEIMFRWQRRLCALAWQLFTLHK
jgi:regulator of protease activity HflC (stomatin/prohibitin superfamily)